MISSKQQVFELAGRKSEDVPLPGNGSMRVQELSVGQRQLFLDRVRMNGPGDELAAYLLRLSAIDENGEALFTDDDLPNIALLSASFLDKASEAIMRISGIGAKKEPLAQSEDSSSS